MDNLRSAKRFWKQLAELWNESKDSILKALRSKEDPRLAIPKEKLKNLDPMQCKAEFLKDGLKEAEATLAELGKTRE